MFGWLGPNSAIGRVFMAIGIGVMLLVTFALGLPVTNGLQRSMAADGSALERAPMIGGVCDMGRCLVELFAQRKDGGMNSMSAVWCHFGGPPEQRGSGTPASQGVLVLALLSTPEPVLIR